MKNHRLYQLFAFLIAFMPSLGIAQAPGNICLGTDATLCLGDPLTIENCNTGAGGGFSNTIINMQNPQSFVLGDDDFTPAINIGFTFNFYGNNYNQVIVGDNGVVSFNVAQANGYCAWSTTALPTATASSQNAILTPWQDLLMTNSGTIYTETLGTAPNRIFVVFFDGMGMFSCTAASQCFTGSVILHEGSNKIITNIANKTICAGWGGGTATHGINGVGGNPSHFVPGRNNTVWAAQNDSWEFMPTSAANYTVNQIPNIIVTEPSGNGLVWEDTNGNSYPYNGGILTTTVQPGVTGYFASAATCGVGVGAVSDTSWITGVSSAVSTTMTDDICSSSAGSVTANPIAGLAPYTFSWPTLGGATTPTVSGVPAGTYQVLMTDAMGCSSSSTVTVGDTPAAFSGTTTQVSCPGGNDGTAFAEMVPPLGNITYQWDDPMMQTTQTATGLTAGNYSCTITSDIGCFGVVNVVVSEIPGMIGVISAQSDVTCNSSNNGMIEVTVTQGTPPYTYSWDNSTSTANMANDLYVGPHTVTVTDANGCVITVSGALNEPQSLSIDQLTPDTQICPEDDITLSVTGSGGSSAYTFTWFENGNQIGTGDQITVDPDVTQTEFCVEMSELCGSPTDQRCTMITFPTPIEPRAIADAYEKCVPDTFYFENTSTNGAEIATTFWEFGDFATSNAIVNGNDPTSHYYDLTGFRTIIMTTTSIYGCVYTDTLENIIEVKPSPSADFNFSNNPATIFETTVYMQNKSSVDVVDWQWSSPFSNPTYSSSSDPVFVFPEEAGVYPVTLAVTTERGCVDTITYQMNVVDDILFFAPNAFTPDGDEFNQLWKPEIKGIDVYGYELLVFNRWGQVIWETHDPTVGWDGTFNGKIVQAGAYAWTAKVKSPYNDDKKVFTGSVSILR